MDTSKSVEFAGRSSHGDTDHDSDSLSGGGVGTGGGLVGGSGEGGLTDESCWV